MLLQELMQRDQSGFNDSCFYHICNTSVEMFFCSSEFREIFFMFMTFNMLPPFCSGIQFKDGSIFN